MSESLSVRSGHLPRSLLAPAGDPRIPLAVARRWIVLMDGDRMRQARKNAGLSQEALASASGVSLTTIGRLERQARPLCHYRTRARIAIALGAHPQAITAASDASAAGVITDAPGDTAARPGWKCSRTFPARADQVGAARAFLRPLLAGCPLADEVLLICSELASNAVQHSASARPGGLFTVRAEVREGDYVWIEVEDEGGRWTHQPRPEERGRGLVVVDGVAAYWDIRGDDTGRAVCARLDWPSLAAARR